MKGHNTVHWKRNYSSSPWNIRGFHLSRPFHFLLCAGAFDMLLGHVGCRVRRRFDHARFFSLMVVGRLRA